MLRSTAGWIVNDKRVEWIWRREALKVPPTNPSKAASGLRTDPVSVCAPSGPTLSGPMTSSRTRIATGTGGWTRLSGYLRNMTVGLAFGVAIEVVGATVLKYVGGAALEKIADARDLAKLIRAEGIPAVRVTSLITRRPEQRAAKVERACRGGM